MKAAVWRRLVQRYLLPPLPSAWLAGSILVLGEVEWLLQGLVVGTSDFNAATIQLSAVNIPLYVPGEGTPGTYGEDLRHPKTGYVWWDVDLVDEELLAQLVLEATGRQALPFFAGTGTPRELAAYSERRYPSSINPPVIEIEAYTWALLAERKRFAEAFERLERAVASMPPTLTWGRPILERARTVRQAVKDGPDAAQLLLGGWRAESIRRLKLEKLVTSS